jgi:hypothetical protein
MSATITDLASWKLRKECERLWQLGAVEELISELDQIAIRVRRLQDAALSEVERLQHWRKLAQLGAQRAEYCERQRRLGGGR